MNKPFVLVTHKCTTARGNVIRINRNAQDCLKEMQAATGLPFSEIASRAIQYAAENLEVQEAE